MIRASFDLKGADSLGRGSSLFVCGAGGKTSFIRELAAAYRMRGWRTAVTTTTKMLMERGAATEPETMLRQLEDGYTFFGTPLTDTPRKMGPPSTEMLKLAQERADILLVEADGARNKSFKVPYPHEPVIPDFADRIAVIYGTGAAGRTVMDAAYNPEGAAAAMGCGTEDIITEDAMLKALEGTYGRLFREKLPGIRADYIAARPGNTVHVIYLAAGFGRRYGSNKLLADVNGRPMYLHLLERLTRLECDAPCGISVTVVTQYDEIRNKALELGCLTAVNEAPERGISSSVKTGIAALKRRGAIAPCDSLMFVNADQPFLLRESILGFLNGMRDEGAVFGAFSKYGELMSPCLFPASAIPLLEGLEGDRGGKSVLKKYEDMVFRYEGCSPKELEDIDLICYD